ncbi:SGNH/GDSL hydrolase family protein [Candidatus Sulfidibacterium hydrothermale]|uniref:SGNH/GDSL hydrolase family protein n=1 Tax=Candidatus Sulfidibacterium hydrothermale TaxID=2875962 RepID=UPI001F0ABF4A|nr:SGNH/GDSL hydrolase family protein [Candidatus Sulfidibacterium hydrothermale]UBM63382.1 SGNH/GDSL hydrolase family protein [Candidatus Sulfidibacterium hydrothermale]
MKLLKQTGSLIFLSVILFSCLPLQAQNAKQFIKPNDNRIRIEGAFFLKKTDNKMIINRHEKKIIDIPETEANPKNAFTQSGVTLSFVSDSKNIKILLSPRKGTSHRHSVFGVFKNGKLYKQIAVLPRKDTAFNGIAFQNPDGKTAVWEIVFPPYYGVNFNGIETDKGSHFAAAPQKDKPVYVAIGNSITQGTGQTAGFQTWPWILAQKEGWQLYNLAVGGSKISWPFALELAGKKVDVITILWGYNDWNKGYTPKKQIIPRYTKLLSILLKDHPKAKIYCITPTFTYRQQPKHGTVSLNEIRQAEADVVRKFQKKGYKNLFLIDGKSLTGPENMKPKGSKDVVHFTPKGARLFAEALYNAINQVH